MAPLLAGGTDSWAQLSCSSSSLGGFAVWQPGWIDEIGQLHGAHLGGSRLPGDLHAHDAVGTNRDALRAGRNRDGGLNLVAARIDELALRVGLEITVAGVCEGSVRLQHLEEAAA